MGCSSWTIELSRAAGLADSDVTDFDADNQNNGGGQSPEQSGNELGLPNNMAVTWTTAVISVWDGDWAILEEYGQNRRNRGQHGLALIFRTVR